MGKMKLTCEEAVQICNKNQYKSATLVELIKLNLHFALCKTCRAFTKQNAELSRMCNSIKSSEKIGAGSFTNEDKENLKAQIRDLKKE